MSVHRGNPVPFYVIQPCRADGSDHDCEVGDHDHYGFIVYHLSADGVNLYEVCMSQSLKCCELVVAAQPQIHHPNIISRELH